jgi:exodeoxyribonuclease VII small subunit
MPRKKEASFEENLANLEQIVDKLESGEASLKDVIDNYTLGMELSRKCLAELQAVEDKMNLILKEQDGEAVEMPLELEGGR